MINKIIEEQKKDFEDKFIINKVEDGEDYTLFLRDKDIWNWHIQSIKQILEEVEKMVESEKKKIDETFTNLEKILSNKSTKDTTEECVWLEADDIFLEYMLNKIK